MQGRRAVNVHWKAERNSSILRRVLNVPILVASRVDELRLFQMVGAAKQKLHLAAADFRKGIRRRCCPSDLRLREGPCPADRGDRMAVRKLAR